MGRCIHKNIIMRKHLFNMRSVESPLKRPTGENTDGQNSGEVHQGVELRAPRTNSDASLRAGDL